MSFRQYFSVLAMGALAALPLAAHPTFSSAGVVNAAGFMPSELAGGAIARGAIFTVFGSELGPEDAVAATELPLATTLAGIQITLSQAGSPDVKAIPLFVSDGQVNAILPSNTPLGEVTLVIFFDAGDGGEVSLPVRIQVVEAAFGIFTANSAGRGPAIATNFNSEADQPLNTTGESAQPGLFVTLWGSGLGAISGPDNVPPGPVDLKEEVEVFVGGLPSPEVFYAGRSPEFPALDQVTFQIPADAPTGCYVPLWVRTKGGRVSNFASLAIAAERGGCDDPLNPYLAPSAGARLGAVVLSRLLLAGGGARDTGTAAFQTAANRRWFFDPAISLPPEGTCTLYTGRNGAGGIPQQAPAAPLDAGDALIVRGPSGSRFLTKTGAGFHAALFEPTQPGDDFLTPGDYTVESSAAETGAFSAGATMFEPPEWRLTGTEALIERRMGATVTWTPGDPDRELARVMLVSSNRANPNNNVTSTLVCSARADAGRLEIPADALANAPQSSGDSASSTAVLYVGFTSQPTATRFESSGLDYGFVSMVALGGRPVDVR